MLTRPGLTVASPLSKALALPTRGAERSACRPAPAGAGREGGCHRHAAASSLLQLRRGAPCASIGCSLRCLSPGFPRGHSLQETRGSSLARRSGRPAAAGDWRRRRLRLFAAPRPIPRGLVPGPPGNRRAAVAGDFAHEGRGGPPQTPADLCIRVRGPAARQPASRGRRGVPSGASAPRPRWR
jgi:hypothetical protein